MATTYAFADLITDVASITNSPTFGANTRITLPQATYWIAQSARALSALLRQKFPADRDYLQFAAIATIPSFPVVSLPPDCGEVHSVVWMRGADDAVLLDTAGLEHITRTPLDTGIGWADDSDVDYVLPRWRLEGQTIAFYPASGLTENVEVFYTTHISPTSGTFQGRLDFDRWITLDVAIKVSTAKKKAQDVQMFQQQKALLENDLLSMARKRNIPERHTIRDVRAERFGVDYRRRWGL